MFVMFMKPVSKPSFREAFQFWLKLGFISFGGPAGQIAIMHEYIVEKKKWISESKFLHALNYCMILPGPEAQQLATYCGWLMHGIRGGIIAGSLFILPSMFILLGLSILYVEFGKSEWIIAMFYLLKPAVIAIVILALIKISKKSLHNWIHYLFALAAFVCLTFFFIPYPIIILAAVVAGFLLTTFFPRSFQHAKEEKRIADDETKYAINSATEIPHVKFSISKLLLKIFSFSALWASAVLIFYLFFPDFIFWKKLSLFFTQAAFVTFGGAYAVLPYVAQTCVENFRWLTQAEMIDGLALGETTPGPLIMVLSFVGFIGAYRNFNGSILLGSAGLIGTTFFTFLPSFLFILIGAPLIERTQQNKKLKMILGFVTAVVAGVILHLTYYMSKAVLFPDELNISELDYLSVIWLIVSFIAMQKFKIGMIKWIVVSLIFGLIVNWVG